MKVIKFKILCGKVNRGTETEPAWEDLVDETEIRCTEEHLEENVEIAKREAHNGEYTIEDDGQPDPAEVPSQLDVIEAQVTYTALMTDTLLSV